MGDPDPDFVVVRSGTTDRPAPDPKPVSGNTCAAQTPTRNNVRFIASFFYLNCVSFFFFYRLYRFLVTFVLSYKIKV